MKVACAAAAKASSEAMKRPHRFDKPCLMTALADAMAPLLVPITRTVITPTIAACLGDEKSKLKVCNTYTLYMYSTHTDPLCLQFSPCVLQYLLNRLSKLDKLPIATSGLDNRLKNNSKSTVYTVMVNHYLCSLGTIHTSIDHALEEASPLIHD